MKRSKIMATATPTPTTVRPLFTIAAEIRKDWGAKVSPHAKPYLDAMDSLNRIGDNYYCDTGVSVVLYFLGNAQGWRGESAKRIKAELRAMADIK
jgi:hypothetical protein